MKNKRKRGLLVLSGRQCSLAVSIHHCDIVLMMNNTESMDAYGGVVKINAVALVGEYR